MASKRISRDYIERIRTCGMERVFERVENGETVGSIAVSLGMSRGFLSTFLNKDPFSADLLALCRAVAAYRRLAARPEGEGRPEARNYSTNGPAMHLEALELIKRRAASVGSPISSFPADGPARLLKSTRGVLGLTAGTTGVSPIGLPVISATEQRGPL